MPRKKENPPKIDSFLHTRPRSLQKWKKLQLELLADDPSPPLHQQAALGVYFFASPELVLLSFYYSSSTTLVSILHNLLLDLLLD